MKLNIVLVAISIGLIGFTACGKKDKPVDSSIVTNSNTASTEKYAGKMSSIEWSEVDYDFGEVIEGQVVVHKYKFKNVGDNDLVILDAKGSCGCTVPEKPEKPVAPGESGEILVKFDSAGRTGAQSKSVTIVANTEPNTHVLKLSGNVVKND